MTEPEEFNDVIEWIQVEFRPEDFLTFDEYIEAVRDEFQNDNLIDAIEPTLEELFNQ